MKEVKSSCFTTQAFECRMCGECCSGSGGIVVTSEEQHRIAAFLRMGIADFQHGHVRSNGLKSFIRSNEQGWCIFFHVDRGCLVHPVKPGPCRAWPFFRGNLLDRSSFEMAREYCPGINPDIDFAGFVRLGIEYLSRHGLNAAFGHESANALHTGDLTGLDENRS